MLKRCVIITSMILSLGSPLVEFSHGADYRVEASLAAYQWVEATEPIAVEESGLMVTVGGWVSGSPTVQQPAIRLRGEVEFFTGWVGFDTAFLTAPDVGVSTHTLYFGSRQEGSMGWRFGSSHSSIEPFVGIGLRSWLRSIQSNSTVQGYPEFYRTVYTRLGLRGAHVLHGKGVYGVASVDPLIWARETIDLTETIYNETLKVRNGKQVGWTLEVGLQFLTLDLGLYWRATRLGESNIVSCNVSASGCLQPRSDQDLIGLKVGWVF